MARRQDAALSMRAATELTGLSEHVIRAWERRYAAIRPTRSEGGTRGFSGEVLDRLRLLKAAVELGHSIGDIARLTDADLRELVPAVSSDAACIDDLIARVRANDADGLADDLSRLSDLFGSRYFTHDVVRPLLVRVGLLWHEGALSVAQEHLATSVTRRHVETLIRQRSKDNSTPLMLFTTPADELHEVGALCASLLASSEGFRVVYLGPNTPAEALAEFSRATDASAVVLGITALTPPAIDRYLRALVLEMSATTRLIVGGEAARNTDLPERVERVDDLTHFERWLERRARDVISH